jgi:hypothetical protein
MNNPTVSNPNDFKVVEFHNSTDFDFTPEMGCMYDSRPISGISGGVGIKSGESITLPYHIGNQIALNLAKYVGTRNSATVDPKDAQGNPMVAPIWSEEALQARKNSFLTDLYTEDKPLGMSETDRLMAKVEEYKQMVDKLVEANGAAPVVENAVKADGTYQDKADVIAELEKRDIQHDKRQTKENLEKLLATPVAE